MDIKKNKPDNKSRECCACNLPKSGDFKQVVGLRNSGLTIFIHKNVEVKKNTRKKSEETFILHNVGERELKRPDYISEICQYKTKCIKCKMLIQKVRSLIDEIDDIKTDEVLGVCEHCRRPNSTPKCRRCEFIVSKYISLKSKVYQNKQARFVAWLTKVNSLLREILDTESICKHKLYRESQSVLEIEQLLSELKSPLSQRQPDITYFPTIAAERLPSFSALGHSKEMLENILKRIITEKPRQYTSEDSLLLSSSRSSTSCVCKYFMSKKMEGRRSMEVLPQEKFYPPGLITSREFAKSLTSEVRLRGSRDKERHGGGIRSSSVEYSAKKSGYYSDYSRDGTSKERGRWSVLDRISSEFISRRSQDSGYSRDNFGKERGSKRDGHDRERGSIKDEYGRIRESKKEIPAGAKDKLPGIASFKSYLSRELIENNKEGKSNRDSSKEDVSKREGTKEGKIKVDTKEGKLKGDRMGEDTLKGNTMKRDKKDKIKETFEQVKEGKTDKLKEDTTKIDKEGKAKEEVTKKDVKVGKSTEILLKEGKTKKDKSKEHDDKEEGIFKKGTKSKEESSKEDNLKKQKKGKGKTYKEDEIAKSGTKSKKDLSKEDYLKKDKISKGKADKVAKEVLEKSKKIGEDIIITEESKKRTKADIDVIIKDEETRKRLKNKGQAHEKTGQSKDKSDHGKDKKSEETNSDKENVKIFKKEKGKGSVKVKEKRTSEISLEKKKKSSEAVLLLKMMKEMRIKREKEREAKKERAKEFAAVAPLPEIIRRVKPTVEPSVSESFVECDDCQVREVQEMIIGKEILPFDPTFKIEENRGHEPLSFKTTQSFPDVLPQIEVPQIEAPPVETEKRPISSSLTKMKSKSKMFEGFLEGTAGVMKYQLSNRKYIEEGWTVLPTTKILRKMNIYNMKIANPEFDFFKVNKKKKTMFYDTGEKLAEIYSNECGKWFYRNGNLALDCYNPTEPNIRKRYIIYSSGEEKENGTYLPITILGLFDELGNAIIYDYFGKARLKYNQSEGVIIDEKIGPPGRWKWHTLNDPPVLQPVFIDTYLQEKYEDLEDFIRNEKDAKSEPRRLIKDPNVDMIMIEFDNFVKEKAHKLLQKFKPFQIRMKAVKISEHFSIRIIDQASVTLTFQDMPNTLRLNLGMNLINTEIVDTETSEVSEVATSYDRIPARTESVSNIQEALKRARKYGKSIRNRGQSSSTV